MNLLVGVIISSAIFGIMAYIDRKIRVGRNLFKKLFYVVAVSAFLFVTISAYGISILDLFHVDVKSFTMLKSFFSSRIFAVIALLVFYLFVFLKAFRVTFSFITKPEMEKEEKAFVLMNIVFDIAVIPNIFLSHNTALFAGAILSIIGTGLALTKLVFSIIKMRKMEVAF